MVKEEQGKRATLDNAAFKYPFRDQLKGRPAGAGTLKHNGKTTTTFLIVGGGKAKQNQQLCEREFSVCVGGCYSGLEKRDLQSMKSMLCS